MVGILLQGILCVGPSFNLRWGSIFFGSFRCKGCFVSSFLCSYLFRANLFFYLRGRCVDGSFSPCNILLIGCFGLFARGILSHDVVLR